MYFAFSDGGIAVVFPLMFIAFGDPAALIFTNYPEVAFNSSPDSASTLRHRPDADRETMRRDPLVDVRYWAQ